MGESKTVSGKAVWDRSYILIFANTRYILKTQKSNILQVT